MGKVKWGGGLSGEDFDSAERQQFAPYAGPPVPNALYCWKIKMLKRSKTSNNNDQLIIGLELTPRRSRPDEKKYAGYYITDYLVITPDTLWKVAPFLDAIDVTGAEFAERTIVENEADRFGSRKITKIGSWVNNGKQYVMGTLTDGQDRDGNPKKVIGGYWPIPEAEDSSAAEADEEEDEGEEEDERPPAKKTAAKKATRRAQEPDPDEEEQEEEETPPRKATKKAAAKKAAPRRAADEEEDEGEEPPF